MTSRINAGSWRRTALVAACVACVIMLVVSGCTRATDPPTWTPSFPPATDLPSQTPSPTASLAPTPTKAAPTTAYQKNVQTASPQLYQQAHDLYVQFYSYESFLEMDGGADELPPEMAALLTGDALTKETQIHQTAKQLGFHWKGSPQFENVKTAQLMTYVPVGTPIALQACEVTSGAELWTADGQKLMGPEPTMVLHRYYMKYNKQHQLVIYDINGGDERLSTCPF